MSDDFNPVEVPVTNNPQIRGFVANTVQGKAAAGRELERQAKIRALKLSGTVRPATILNFNPLPLRIESGIETFQRNITVPAATDRKVPEELKLRLVANERQYVATYCTIREPIIYPRIKDVKEKEGELIGDYDFEVCKPIEMAHAIFSIATVGAADSLNMGGVLIWEGDRHILKKLGKKPEERMIKVPTFEVLPNRMREYFTVDKNFDEMLHAQLEQQKLTCEANYQQAQAYFDDPDQRKNINIVHRTWGQFALEMGWKEKPPVWLTSIDDPTETCKGCGSPKARAEAFFCHKCNRPYDAHKAYMAGEDVPLSYLSVYEGKELAEIRKEMKRRKDKFEDLA